LRTYALRLYVQNKNQRFKMSHRLNVRIKEETLHQADRLKDCFKTLSRSDVVRRSIELSDTIYRAVEQGDKIIIEGEGGRRQLILSGLKHTI